MKRLLRIAALICVLLGVLLPASAAASSAATPSPATTSTTPAACNPLRSHDSRDIGPSVGGPNFVRCAVALHPSHDGPALAPSASGSGQVDDKIDFCNTTGGIIACFNALLHYVSATEFTLYDIELSDDLNDGRSVYADVDTQAVDFGYFSNSDGQGTTVYDSSGYDFTDSFDGVQYVYIDLYACGLLTCSSDAYSSAQDNPDFTASASASARSSVSASASPGRPNPGTVRAPSARWSVRAMSTAERNQVGLDAEASAIHRLVAADRLPGYAGLTVHPASDYLTVYWNGQLPAALKDRAQARKNAGAVQFSSARFSLAELDALRAKIVRSPGFRQSGIVLLEPAPDGSSLQVGVSTAPARAQALSAIRSEASEVTYTRQAATPFSGRWADIPPFFGGALIHSATGDFDCSSGWPVHAEASPSTFYLITAAHCTHVPEGNITSNVFTTAPYTGIPVKNIGTASNEDLTLDAGLINLGTNGSPFGGDGNSIYTGQVDPAGTGFLEMSAGLDGMTANNVGDTVCTSGAYSGEICGLDITSTDADWVINYGDVEAVVVGLQIENPSQASAAGQGDSGGPIYSYVNAGLVAARGTVSAGDVANAQALCTGVLYSGNNPNNPPRLCSWRIFAPDINQIVDSPFLPATVLNNEP